MFRRIDFSKKYVILNITTLKFISYYEIKLEMCRVRHINSNLYGGTTMEEKKTNWGVIIGVVVATIAVLAVGAVFAIKLLKKKKACCCEDELCDEDICVLDEELEIEAE